MTRAWLALIASLLISCVRAETVSLPALPAEPDWQTWSKAAFEGAQRERKLLLVSVQAGWCHWCHVMNATTYRDARVVALLRERFVTIRVDQDSRPDLAQRYADWGWPATGLLTPDARTIVNLRGHQPADRFLALLTELVNELDHGGPLATRRAPPAALALRSDLDTTRDDALKQLDETYDLAQGGWGAPQKYPLASPIEHALFRSHVLKEDARLTQATQTLAGYEQLIDPVAGGAFQYSLRGVWTAPHYEKIAPIQAALLIAFAQAYRATRAPEYRTAAEQIARYVSTILQAPSGGFYTSQDADSGQLGAPHHMEGARYYALDARARTGVATPRIDRHLYANMNGMLIRGLCELSRANADARFRVAAQAAALDMEGLRAGRAFRHERSDASGVFYLADQVEMAAALDALADLTLDPQTRRDSDKLLDYIVLAFRDPQRGALLAHTPDPNAVGELAVPTISYADNALAARLLLRRSRRHANEPDHALALGILRALSDPAQMRAQGRMIGEYLLALEEARGPYAMFSVVGPLEDPRTQALARAAHGLYAPHGFIHVATPDASRYPYPGRPAVYLCSDTACSAPVSEVSELEPALLAFTQE